MMAEIQVIGSTPSTTGNKVVIIVIIIVDSFGDRE